MDSSFREKIGLELQGAPATKTQLFFFRLPKSPKLEAV